MENNQRILNWKREPVDKRDIPSKRYSLAPISLPEKFELPLQVPIYDQLDIGSCVANSACACYRYESAQVLNNFEFDPSRLFVYYNARSIQGWENEDSGSYIRDGFKALNKWGLAKESIWPYITKDFAKKPTPEVYTDGLNNITIKYGTVNQSESAIKQTLMSGAAVSFGFNVYSSFFGNWEKTTGIMPIPKPNEYLEGGHAVTIIGWDDSKKSFLIQNSWGLDWGLQGKFWMPYSFLLNSNEADDFWCIEEIKITNPTPHPIEPIEPTPTGCLDPFKLFNSYKELTKFSKAFLVKLSNQLGLEVKKTKALILGELKVYLKL